MPFLTLAITTLAAASPGGFAVVVPAGPIPVEAELIVVAEPGGETPRLRFRQEGAGLLAEWHDPRLEARVRIGPGPGAGFEVAVEVEWKAPAVVESLGLQLRLPGAARALGRDLALTELRVPRRIDLGTPLFLATAGLALAGGPGLAAARLAPSGGATEVTLLLDDPGAHPFSVYESCLAELPPAGEGGRSWAALEHKRRLDRTPRLPGQREGAAFQLLALRPGEPLHPLVPERWPAATRAALVLTDHADRTDPAALRAVLLGVSDRSHPDTGRRGILPRGLRITKSFFARDKRGGLLDDPEAADLAWLLQAAGSEVALHSPGTGPDDRAAVARALRELAPWHMVTWIDHQPYTNCEAFASRGWEASGRYGIRDLLLDAGFRWVWEANDLAGFGRPTLQDLLSAAAPAEPAPPVYPLPADPRLWVFQSTFFYGAPEALGEALSEEGLDRLERLHGLFVGHTYLSASERTTRHPAHRARLAVRPAPGGGLEIHPALDRGLARAQRRVERGSLAPLTLAEAGDRLRALRGVRVLYLADGAALVENRGPAPVPMLQLHRDGSVALRAEGPEGGGHAQDAGESHLFFDLPPGESARVEAEGPEGPVPFLAAEPLARLAPW
ncbi:MAG: hypothetical protein HZB56_22220 [Deltaproteobacteria bacterium]|nr:hypothetical protein [Deltaproteobacteria bacterium]